MNIGNNGGKLRMAAFSIKLSFQNISLSFWFYNLRKKKVAWRLYANHKNGKSIICY